MPLTHSLEFRVSYADTDQMGTYANGRALEWFERGRTEMLRGTGMCYREMERHGLMLPVREAHVEYVGRAQYDDLLRLTASFEPMGRIRIRVNVEVVQAETGETVCRGYTVHAIVNREGKPMRPPTWFRDWLEQFASEKQGEEGACVAGES